MTIKCKCHHYILPLTVILFILLAYFIYFIGFCVYLINSILESVLYILFLNVLLCFLVWSFMSVVFTPVATVPLKYKLSDEDVELLDRSDDINKNLILSRIITAKNLIVLTRLPNGTIRYCLKCKHIKPDRAHHCSTCEVCVLKMDHHCPWVNKCIGFSNYKSFILFLFYMALYCIYFVCTSLKYLITIIYDKEARAIVVCYVIVVCYGFFGITMFIYNCTLICNNETSVDILQEPIIIIQNATYNLGCSRNFLEVFGKNWRLWPFPIYTSLGSGYVFPIRILQTNHPNV